MFRSRNLLTLIGFMTALVIGTASAAEVRLITDRTDFHLRPLIEQYEAQTGNKVKAAFVEDGSIPARLSANPTEADVIITTDSALLEMAKQRGWTRALPKSAAVDALDPAFVDDDRHYTALSYRVRSIVFNPDTIGDRQLADYDDLASGKFKVCMRPLSHSYNINLVAQMIADRGEEYARAWVRGVTKNLAMKPQGNDRSQGVNVAEGACDIAVMNSYYYALMMNNKSQRKAATKISLYFPAQGGKGSYVLVSGAALTKSNNPDAVKFVEFLLKPSSQSFISHVNYEYPVAKGVDLPVMMHGFAEGQPGVTKGMGKFNFVSLTKIAKNRELAIKVIADEAKN